MKILTGDRPSGKLHLGHYVGSLENRIKLQHEAEQFIIIADVQALTDNYHRPEILKENIFQVVCDYLAVGIDPEKSIIFIQSMIPEIAELTVFFMNLVTVARLQRNPTVKTEIKQKGFTEKLPVGFFVYPISQAADILIFQPTHIPVGEDQIPMIEQTNEIARSFNVIYKKELFSDVTPVVPKIARLMGIDGKAKMSKSLNNGIFLSDSKEIIDEKIRQMYTDPAHIKVSDPGSIEGNVVFSYLDIFDPNKQELEELKIHYQKGGLGDMVLKKRLSAFLNEFLDPIREKRIQYEKEKNMIWDIVFTGTKKAQTVAHKTMEKVKEAMKISYFDA
jgi:tryptophanyl-tRNA synthetase